VRKVRGVRRVHQVRREAEPGRRADRRRPPPGGPPAQRPERSPPGSPRQRSSSRRHKTLEAPRASLLEWAACWPSSLG